MTKIADINPYAKGDITDNASARKLEDAVSEFEAVFIYQMLKTMRETITRSSLTGDGRGEEIYTSMLDHELSTAMAKAGGIGLKEMLLRDFGAHMATQEVLETPQEARPLQAAPTPITVIKKGDMAPEEAPATSLDRGIEVNQRESPIPKGYPTPSNVKEKDFMPLEPSPEFKSPVKRSRISSNYGMRHDPITSERRFHHGIDIAAPEGTPVRPSMAGTVIFSGHRDGYGNMVEIRHDNGYVTRYAHTRENLASAGQRVTTDDTIALVGSTGRSTGPHLHFEVRLEGYALNPLDMVNFG